MRLALTDEQEMLVEALRQALGQQAPLEQVRSWLDAGDLDTPHAWLVDGGWAGIGVPEDAGGQGGGFLDVALVAEELARGGLPDASWLATSIAVPLLAGTPALLAAVAGGAVVAVATDSGAVPGRHPSSLHADSSTRSGSVSGTVTGTVPRVLGADRAAHLLVPLEEGRRWVVVAADAEGVHVEPRPMMDRGRPLATVTFDGAVARPLELPVGLDAMAVVRERAAVLVAADALGTAQRMLDMTVAYTLQREQFGVPIASFQAVKHAAAKMLVAIEPVRSVVRVAASGVGAEPGSAALHAAIARTHAGSCGVEVAEAALTLHGAIGFTWEHDLQLFYKRAKLDALLFGDAGAWADETADLLDLTPA